jgi:hypothetical protein
MKKNIVVLFVFVFFPLSAQAEGYSFYGLKFGMTAGEVGQIFPFEVKKTFGTGTVSYIAKNPGHGMKFMYLHFDQNDRLYQLSGAFPYDNTEIQRKAAMLAIKEKFEATVKERFKDIDVQVEGVWSHTRIRVTLKSKSLEKEYVEHLKEGYLWSIR